MVNPDLTLPWITFVIHDIEGGVASMNHQIIENADFNQLFNVHIVLWRSLEEKTKNFRDTFTHAKEVTSFHFSVRDNYYHTLKRFSALLNKWPGSIVTNDGMEMEAIRAFGTRSVLFSIVHDFYNLKLAIENLDITDHYLCHTGTFSKALLSSGFLQQRVHYLLHGVKVIQRPMGPAGEKKKLRIISISRLTASKGVALLFGIDQLLQENGTEVEWVIIGSGEMEAGLKQQWAGRADVSFHKPDTQDEVYAIASSCDIFISPSSFEGYGIALLEAMSCGLVPVIHKLPVGIYSALPADIGFSVPVGDIKAFAECIVRLDKDRSLLAEMGRNAHQLITTRYDISKTARNYLECFEKNPAAQVDKQRIPARQVRFGLLDSRYMPNSLVRMVRKLHS